MLNIEYNHTNYYDLLAYYSNKLKAPVINNTITIPETIADGYIKMIELPNGLHCLLSDYTAKKQAIIQRKKCSENLYVLRFDEIITKDEKGKLHTKSAASLTNTTYDWIFFENEDTKVRSLSIIFSDYWLQQWLSFEQELEVIKICLSNPANAYNFEPLDTEYKYLFDLLFAKNISPKIAILYYQNRVMLLMERFFSRLYLRNVSTTFDSKISSYDLERLREVEELLLRDFANPPKSIVELSKIAAISSSKLKHIFKESYGLPIHQYYQKHRMNKAKAMLLSKKYTTKKVSEAVGYEDVSSFLKAFKKAFDQHPSSITGEAV